MSRILALFLAICIQSVATLAQQKPCSDAESQQSEAEADSLRTWDALYRSYRLYAHCGNASAAEGYSESVAGILVDHWQTLSRLSQLAKKDKDFRDFVLGHVDATLDMGDVKKIHANAIQHCPSALRNLCEDLKREAESALQEDASVHKK